MNLYMFVMICFGRRCFATDSTLEWSFAGVTALMLFQIIRSMKYFVACFTFEILRCDMFTCVTQPIIFSGKLTTTIVTSVRFYRFVRVHMGCVFSFSHKCFCTQTTFERFIRATCMDPLMLFQIPFCGQRFIANWTFVRCFLLLVRFHVNFQTWFNVFLLAVRTLDSVTFQRMKTFSVRQTNVTHQTIFVHETFTTIRTTFRLRIVCFAMPCNFRLRMKHFATRTNVIFVVCTNFEMVSITMLN